MKIINPSYEIISEVNGKKMLEFIERCGRVCYKSEDLITEWSALKFVEGIIKSKHESVLEHQSITVKFIISRATSHQLVRHRLASYSQASQRYCNYSKGKFGNEVTFIIPYKFKDEDIEDPSPSFQLWLAAVKNSELSYMALIERSIIKPQDAREVLPNSTMTELIVTANLREWRTILKLRTSNAADDGIRYIMRELLKELKTRIPIVFDDILKEEE